VPVETGIRGFLDDVISWASDQEDIRAVVLLGSHARAESPADEHSDVDVVLFADDPDRYLGDDGWLRQFGEPLLTFVEATPVGGFDERRVLFLDGLEVDFVVPPSAAARATPADAGEVFARGFEVLYDDGIGVAPPPAAPRPVPPTQAKLDQFSNDFWYHVLWAAKKLRRGEVLLAKQACDCRLTAQIVELARWRAHGSDTWHGLRFFERWAGDDVVEALRPTFAAYDAEDVARALRAKGELFGRLEDEVAARFGLAVSVDRGEILRRL
jgi:aminoglycoside 6-adenylyltransferase